MCVILRNRYKTIHFIAVLFFLYKKRKIVVPRTFLSCTHAYAIFEYFHGLIEIEYGICIRVQWMFRSKPLSQTFAMRTYRKKQTHNKVYVTGWTHLPLWTHTCIEGLFDGVIAKNQTIPGKHTHGNDNRKYSVTPGQIIICAPPLVFYPTLVL